MDITEKKSHLESKLTPLASRIPLSPNLISIIAVLAMLGAAWFVLNGSYVVAAAPIWSYLGAAALIILSGFLDVLDGTVAKAQNKATPFGALLDRVCDRISDALIFGAIILASLVTLWLGLVVLVLVLLGSYVSSCIEAATKTHIGEKLSMRAVRLVLLVIGLLLVATNSSPPVGGSLLYMDYIFGIILILTLFSIAQRMWTAWKILRTK